MSNKPTDKKLDPQRDQLLSKLEKTKPPGQECSVYLQALLEHTDDSILICDEKGVPRLFNSAYAAMMKKVFGLEIGLCFCEIMV